MGILAKSLGRSGIAAFVVWQIIVACCIAGRGAAARRPREPDRGQAIFCPGGEARRSLRGQRLCAAQGRADRVAVLRRSVLRAIVRRALWHSARAHPELARLGRAGRSKRPRRHQQPRHPGQRRGRDYRRPVRRARVPGQGRAQGRADRSCRAPPGRQGHSVPFHPVQRLRQPRSRRSRARHRRSVRRRPDGDERHRLGAGPHSGRHFRLSVLHPDRRGD